MTTLGVLRFPAAAEAGYLQAGLEPHWHAARAEGAATAILLNHARAGSTTQWSERFADGDTPARVRSLGAACACCERSGTLGLLLAAVFRDLARSSPHPPLRRQVFLIASAQAKPAALRRQLRWLNPSPAIHWEDVGLL